MLYVVMNICGAFGLVSAAYAALYMLLNAAVRHQDRKHKAEVARKASKDADYQAYRRREAYIHERMLAATSR